MSRQANRDERKVVARDARDVVRGGVARRHVAPLREGIYLCVQQWQCVWLVFRRSFSQLRVRLDIIRNARIKIVGKYYSCMVYKLRIIFKRTHIYVFSSGSVSG